jgi:hypothetical protein
MRPALVRVLSGRAVREREDVAQRDRRRCRDDPVEVVALIDLEEADALDALCEVEPIAPTLSA